MEYHGFNLSILITDKPENRHYVLGCGFPGCLMLPDRSVHIALHKHNLVPLDTSALNNTQNNHDDCDNQQNVNESADCVRGNQTQYPKDD